MRVRIIGVPPGEAPEEVRRAWVGLILPVVPSAHAPRHVPHYGVLSGPYTWLGHIGRLLLGRAPARSPCYIVPVDAALDVLKEASPEAVAWWRQNTPHLIGRRRMFGFPVEVCEELA
jgi:hypothetical protein